VLVGGFKCAEPTANFYCSDPFPQKNCRFGFASHLTPQTPDCICVGWSSCIVMSLLYLDSSIGKNCLINDVCWKNCMFTLYWIQDTASSVTVITNQTVSLCDCTPYTYKLSASSGNLYIGPTQPSSFYTTITTLQSSNRIATTWVSNSQSCSALYCVYSGPPVFGIAPSNCYYASTLYAFSTLWWLIIISLLVCCCCFRIIVNNRRARAVTLPPQVAFPPQQQEEDIPVAMEVSRSQAQFSPETTAQAKVVTIV
jgi:hypothetical protein